jgi:hypothetical protein
MRQSVRCMVWSILLGEWRAVRYHWLRVKRAMKGRGR